MRSNAVWLGGFAVLAMGGWADASATNPATAPALTAAAAAMLQPAHGAPAAEQSHSFDLTYRSFGRIDVVSTFQPAAGYDIRFEGCFARQSQEAICGFTLRARRALTITNVANLSHGARTDGSDMRTCCMFQQGDSRGFPITKSTAAPAGAAVYGRALRAGKELGLMLRLPDYKAGAPLASITFSRGEGDAGATFPAQVREL